MSSSSIRLPSPERSGPGATAPRVRSELPTPFEMLESVLLLITGAVLAAPILPGFTLCVAGLILLAVVVLAPLMAAAALVALAGATLAIPYLLVRSVRGDRSRRTVPAPDRSAAADTARPRAAAAFRVLG